MYKYFGYDLELVRRFFQYMLSAYRGLTEEEIIDLISMDETAYQAFLKNAYHMPSSSELPVITWIMLNSSFDILINQHFLNGILLFKCSDKDLTDVLCEEDNADETLQEISANLAKYFLGTGQLAKQGKENTKPQKDDRALLPLVYLRFIKQNIHILNNRSGLLLQTAINYRDDNLSIQARQQITAKALPHLVCTNSSGFEPSVMTINWNSSKEKVAVTKDSSMIAGRLNRFGGGTAYKVVLVDFMTGEVQKYLPAKLIEEPVCFLENEGIVLPVVWLNDGSTLVSLQFMKSCYFVKLNDTEMYKLKKYYSFKWKLLGYPPGNDDISVASSNDSKLVAFGGKNKMLVVVDIENRREIGVWYTNNEIRALKFSPDDNMIFVGNESGEFFNLQLVNR